jgi:hypothetical protein
MFIGEYSALYPMEEISCDALKEAFVTSAQDALDQRLFSAITDGDWLEMTRALKDGANSTRKTYITSTQKYRTYNVHSYCPVTPLSYAIVCKRFECLDYLLYFGASVKSVNGSCPIQCAINSEHGSVLKKLFAYGADCPSRAYQRHLFNNAILGNCFHTAQQLLMADNKVIGRREIEIAYQKKGAWYVLENLVLRGHVRLGSASDEDCGKSIMSALAERTRYWSAQAYLIEGDSVNQDIKCSSHPDEKRKKLYENILKGSSTHKHRRTTPIHWAVAAGDRETLLWYLAEGRDATYPDRYGNTLADIAYYHGHYDCLKLLLRQGGCHLMTSALHELAHNKVDENRSIKNIMQEYKQLINSKNWLGNTPLHETILDRNQFVLDLLLKNGANGSLRNCEGRTAWQLACIDPFWHQSAVLNNLLNTVAQQALVILQKSQDPIVAGAGKIADIRLLLAGALAPQSKESNVAAQEHRDFIKTIAALQRVVSSGVISH